MLVGAQCRDVLHARQGHAFSLRATDDVDIGIALADWDAYGDLTSRLTRSGHTGIQFEVAGVRTDLLPFGEIERPAGTVTPEPRTEPLSVWAFREVFDGADTLALPTAGSIRIPTVAGYVALKLAAWLDRSPDGQYKDAGDLAAAMHWYAESEAVVERLYTDEAGQGVLLGYEVDTARGTAHLLGLDVSELIGPSRSAELRARWPGERGDLLPAEMSLPTGASWPTSRALRLERVRAFEDGLGLTRTT